MCAHEATDNAALEPELSFIFVFSILVEAAHRFYKSKQQDEALKRNGKSEERKIARRQHERMNRVSM